MEILKGPDSTITQAIKEELKEDDDRMKNNLRLLEEWMNCQPHLPNNFDRRMLPIYLRGTKHDMEKSKKKLEQYFMMRTSIPQVFKNRKPTSESMLKAYKVGDVICCPKLTKEGYRVSISCLYTSDVSVFSIDEQLIRGSMITDLRTVEEYPIAGDVLIYDAQHITTAHLGVIMTPLLRKCLLIAFDAYPNRIRQVHIVHVAPIVETLVNLIKPLLKEKLRNRIVFHKSVDTLRKHISEDILPAEYGGKEVSIKQLSSEMQNYLIKTMPWFMEQEDIVCTGPIPDKYKFEENFGADGSFRNLAVD